jgi:hypothetical protein
VFEQFNHLAIRPPRQMAKTLILSYRRPLACPVRVSAIFERSFLALSELSIRGGRKRLLEPLLGMASTTRGHNSLFPARGLKLYLQYHKEWKYICRHNSLFPARGLKQKQETQNSFHLFNRHNSLFPARGLKHNLKVKI